MTPDIALPTATRTHGLPVMEYLRILQDRGLPTMDLGAAVRILYEPVLENRVNVRYLRRQLGLRHYSVVRVLKALANAGIDIGIDYPESVVGPRQVVTPEEAQAIFLEHARRAQVTNPQGEPDGPLSHIP